MNRKLLIARRDEIREAIAKLSSNSACPIELKKELQTNPSPERAAQLHKQLQASERHNLELAAMHAMALKDLKEVEAKLAAQPIAVAKTTDFKTVASPVLKAAEKPIELNTPIESKGNKGPLFQLVRGPKRPKNNAFRKALLGGFLSFTGDNAVVKTTVVEAPKTELKKEIQAENKAETQAEQQLELLINTGNPDVQIRVPLRSIALGAGGVMLVVVLIIFLSRGRKAAH